MKKKFLETIKALFGFEDAPKEEVYDDLSEVEKWQAKVSDRCYNKDDLIYFVQYGHEKNKDDIYFMCGYLNADGTRFRDLSTGAVYDVFDASYPDRNTMIGESIHSTISYGNSSFVRVEPEVTCNKNDKRFTRWIDVGIAGTALATEWYLSGFMDDGRVLRDYWKLENGYAYVVAPALYHLISKNYVASGEYIEGPLRQVKFNDYGLASGEDILCAVKQANKCCIDNVNYEAKRRQRIAEGGQDAPKKDVSLTPEELDF